MHCSFKVLKGLWFPCVCAERGLSEKIGHCQKVRSTFEPIIILISLVRGAG